jgi:hypothetical protein
MGSKYNLDELLETPGKPLTMEQWNNLDLYMRDSNDDKSAAEVDIAPGVERAIAEIRRKKSYWF